MSKFSPFLFFFLLLAFACTKTGVSESGQLSQVEGGFVKVDGSRFTIDGKPYFFMGTNFWYGLNLGSNGAGGDRRRLIRELDRLDSLGVKNLRVMAGSEGPDNEPWRMLPSLQPKPGEYNQDVLEGLDFLLSEMRKRKMYAVMCLNNFWPWSGGMGQYLVWAGAADSIPYPPPHPGGDWGNYAKFTAKFYSNEKAQSLFLDHVNFIISRTNEISGIPYKNDPTIMAWELANEPRGVDNKIDFAKWVETTSAFIKKLDPIHLVTTGSEGNTSDSLSSGTNIVEDHKYKNIDYATIHIWVQNWGYYVPEKADSTLPLAIDYALNYIKHHIRSLEKVNKPLVLEEFGISRDLDNHEAHSPTTVRDRYYSIIFEEVLKRARQTPAELAGVNFWAWGGEGRPKVARGVWKQGDDFVGDPPHEFQGWYSVFDKDHSTKKIIKEYAAKMSGVK